MKPKEIFNPVFRYYLVVFKGSSLKQAKDYATRKLDQEFKIQPGTIACVFRVEDVDNHVIWFKDKKPSPKLVAHEALHSVFHLMKCKNTNLTYETEETFAYLLEWTIEKIIKGSR